MKRLYRFEEDFGRMGDLRGLFVADDADVAAAIGKRAYFGEVLGKYSAVVIEKLVTRHFKALTDDAAFIAKFQEFGCRSGFNPLNYITCQECGEELEPPFTPHDHEGQS